VPTTIDLEVAELCSALAVRLPASAFFCGPTAAMLYGIPLPRRLERHYRTHVGVPAPATAPVGRGIAGHSYRIVDRELTLLHGVRVTTASRTWCELSLTLSLDELIAAGDYLIHYQRELATRAELAELALRFPAPRNRRARYAALTELDDRADSPQETALRLLCLRSGLNGIESNFWIDTSGGYRFRVDLAFPAQKVIIEYQSGFHETTEKYRADKTRRSRLEADQWMMIEVTADDLRNPTELLARIRRVLAARAGVATFAR
jgi:very-short-patch-repair endonuclease